MGRLVWKWQGREVTGSEFLHLAGEAWELMSAAERTEAERVCQEANIESARRGLFPKALIKEWYGLDVESIH